MWIQHASRSELLDFVQGDNGAFGQAQEIEYTPSLRGELLFAWTNDPKWTRELPNLIVVDDDLHQFFAWTSTYLKNAKPLTALSRVVSSDGVSRLFESERYVAPSGLQTACLGVMAAEAVTHSASDTVRGVSRSALSETLSYAASQLMSHDPTPIEIPSLALHWASAQGFAGRANRRSDLDDVCNTWLVLFALRQAFSRHAAYMTLGSLPDELHDIASACREIATGGEISRDSWRILTRNLSESRLDPEELTGPRDERVEKVEGVLANAIAKKRKPTTSQVFACSYLASRIAPGSIEHLSFLKQYATALPGLLLWYGLCAGLNPKSSVRNIGAGLGRRVIYESMDHSNILDRPRCDLSLAELEATALNEMSREFFREGSSVTVEIAPCIDIVLRREVARPVESASAEQKKLFRGEENDPVLQDLLFEIGERLKSVEVLWDKIQRHVGQPKRGRGRKR